MIAYNFQPMFVAPILVGLGRADEVTARPLPPPKRQTIRAVAKRKHAADGDLVHLYTGMRTASCRAIGVARCVGAREVRLYFAGQPRGVDVVEVDGWPILTAIQRAEFARADGFEDWAVLRAFWAKHHPGVDRFVGRLILWEPIA